MRWIFLFLFVVMFTTNTRGQIHYYGQSLWSVPKGSNIPPKVSLRAFDSAMKKYVLYMAINRTLNEIECYELVRIQNTVWMGHVFSKEAAFNRNAINDRLFSSLFDGIYMMRCVEVLSAYGASRGMGFYSEKWRLAIGGAPDLNSMYLLTKN